MIKPISVSSKIFRADNIHKDEKTGEYKDPLMKWPLRGMAYTNEVGEALRPLIGNSATLFWAPVFLYIGADIYDKYKNDQNEYSPDSRRCLKQAIFQGLASVLFPLIAIKGGQSIFSLFGRFANDKITYNAQDQVVKLAQQFVANGKMHAYSGKEDECIKDFIDIVDNNLTYKRQVKASKTPFKYSFLEKFKVNKKENVSNYAKRIITELIDTRKSLLNPTEDFKNSKLYSNFNFALENGQTKNVAVKSILNQLLSKKTLFGKFIKTVGGFLVVAFMIKPIDKFVEYTLIDKYIGPTIDKTKKSA